MSNTVYQKDKIQRRLRLDDNKFMCLISEGIIQDKLQYSEKELEEIKRFLRDHPYSRDEIKRKYKTDSALFDRFIELGFIKNTQLFKENEIEIFQSFVRLRRLGYKDEDCLTVLTEVGVPKDENLAENKLYIQLKDLSNQTKIPERTIKFYEKENLILPPRIYKNKRFYECRIISELELIRDMQSIGYKLNDMASFLEKVRSGDETHKSEARRKLLEELETKKNIIKKIQKKVGEL
ncbi:MerR family transcriptional regulator [Oceanispirochaeta sp.]|uniref:MerR family transcriptional regulator n=1 Tax=Oceanispirochaeta sp. TaxID=2035350 RepID=UPI0026216A94|nr:MerR family transcriptional regulator [Oceanispirochaeta sp.]MDA3955649.1 MerR family transcriptional regulator [Oceanispirochaeta sp.]